MNLGADQAAIQGVKHDAARDTDNSPSAQGRGKADP